MFSSPNIQQHAALATEIDRAHHEQEQARSITSSKLKMERVRMNLKATVICICLLSTVTALPNPLDPYFWPLTKIPPKPQGYNEMKHDPPYNTEQCETLALPFKTKVEDCLWVPYSLGADCVRSKLSEKEYEEYDSLYQWGCIVPGISGHVDPNFMRRDIPDSTTNHIENKKQQNNNKEAALPPLSHFSKSGKALLPFFTPEQCRRIEKSFISRTIACGLEPKANRYECVKGNLTRSQWRSFKEAVARGCTFNWMKGNTRGQNLVRRDQDTPDTHRPSWMSDWDGVHWEAWEKFENVKLKDFIINKLDNITPDIPASWLLHYPFAGGKGRIGKTTDEQPKYRHSMTNGGAPYDWDDTIIKRSELESTSPVDGEKPVKNFAQPHDAKPEGKRHAISKRQRFEQADPENPNLTKAAKHNDYTPVIPDWETKNNMVPTFEGRRCFVVDEHDEHISYEEAKKDENGYVRVKCSGPEVSNPDVQSHPVDTTRPINERAEEAPAAHVDDGNRQIQDTNQPHKGSTQERADDQNPPIVARESDRTDMDNPTRELLNVHIHAFEMGTTPIYGSQDWRKSHPEHWADQPVYYKNHQLAQNCYNMNFHYTMMTCYLMWKPGSG